MVTAIGCARAHATSTVQAWGLASLSDDAGLVTSELVTNAVRATGVTDSEPGRSELGHPALTRLRLTVLGNGLIIEVWDREAAPPVLRNTPAVDDQGGRGLLIVAGLSRRWNYYGPAEGGKWVWAELAIPADPGPLPRRPPAHVPPPARPRRISRDPALLQRVHDGLKRL